MSKGKKLPKYYGQGGRLSSGAHPALAETAYRHECSDREVISPFLHDADLAHGLALYHAGVIPHENAVRLFKGLLSLDQANDGFFDVDETLGDLYNSKDSVLRNEIGDDAGWIHAARPRREAINIAYLMACKEKLFGLLRTLTDFGSLMCEKSVAWNDVLMPDFTYLQPAHPTNLGHYLLTFTSPLQRDFTRCMNCLEHLDQSPAGSGSTNGTRVNLDREELASLLGFSGVAIHTRDAMWQPDVPVEILGAMGSCVVNLSRFAEELQIWVSAAFDFVSFKDGFFRSSVIMPHKRNPYAMAYVRGVAGWLSGQLASSVSLGRTFSGNPDSRFFLYGMVPESIDKVNECLRLLTELVRTMEPNRENMSSALNQHFLQATDLADLMMETGKVDYRSAHQISGRISKEVAEGRVKPCELTSDIVAKLSLEAVGIELKFTDHQIQEILSHEGIVESRNGLGGAARVSVKEQAERLAGIFNDGRNESTARAENFVKKRIELRKKVANIVE